MRLAWKAWCETRARFALSAAILLVAPLAAGLRGPPALVWSRAYGESSATLFVLVVITLGGGSLRQERALGTLGFTLALPVSRARLVLARAATGFVEVAALVALVAVEVLALAPWPAGTALTMALLWAAFGALLLALAQLASSCVESETVAWLVAFLAFLAYEALVNLTALRAHPALDLYRFLGGAGVLAGEPPWATLAAIVALTAGLVAASVRAA